ncbi:DUF6114 domain-containing protein [Streptomyces sp. NPDC059828]|uniref:DUF6114 domain-containing protein n=1 Tax=Streptomyces sp. NPDC059828 TaxID=3346965 RepID=UPI0036603058
MFLNPGPTEAAPRLSRFPVAGREHVRTARHRFRAWRGSRPFWAGLFTLTAGVPILYFPYVRLSLSGIPLALSTTAGAGALITGVLLIALGVSLWVRPQTRVFAGIAGLLLSLVSFPLANFGGLFLGLLAGLIGGSLACAWAEPAQAGAPDTDV